MRTAAISRRSVDLWLDHPLVRTVRAMLPPDSEPLDLLERLHRKLTELDERFPGMRLSEIISTAPAADVGEVRAVLAARGVAEADIDIVAPVPGVKLTDGLELDLEAASTDLSVEGIMEEFGVGKHRAKRISWLRNEPTEQDAKIATLVADGVPKSKVASKLGVSHATVRWAWARWLFHHAEDLL